MVPAIILSRHLNISVVLVKQKLWVVGLALEIQVIFHGRDSLPSLVLLAGGDSDPAFSMSVTGYELEVVTWLGCGSGGHRACRHSLPWCTSQMKWGVGLFEGHFLWGQSLIQGSLGGIPTPQQSGTAQVERKPNQDPDRVKQLATKLKWWGGGPRCGRSRGRGKQCYRKQSFAPKTLLQSCRTSGPCPLWF